MHRYNLHCGSAPIHFTITDANFGEPSSGLGEWAVKWKLPPRQFILPWLAREGEWTVEARVSLLTLGVSDLQRAVAFYRDGLGWPKSEIGGEEVAFFNTGGVVIALFPRPSFASDAGLDLDDVEHGGFARISLAHNVAEENQVDSVLRDAAEAGATIVKEAQEIFFGRHGFFADPEGFLWEVAWNPSFPMAADGSIELPN
jgi:uncharacterized protein